MGQSIEKNMQGADYTQAVQSLGGSAARTETGLGLVGLMALIDRGNRERQAALADQAGR